MTSRRSPTARWRDGRGRGVADRTGERAPAGRPARRAPRSRRSSWRRRRGSPSSTAPTACSGCSCSPSRTSARLLTVADVTAAMSVEALLGTDQAFLPELVSAPTPPGAGRQRREPRPRCSPGRDRRVAPRRRRPCPGRLLASVRAAGDRGGGATRSPTPGWSRTESSPRRSTTRSSSRTARFARTATSTGRRSPTSLDFLAIAAADLGLDRRAPHRSDCWTRPV